MGSKNSGEYFNHENLEMRTSWLGDYGHGSNVWLEKIGQELEQVIEIVDPSYVSKPCWKEVSAAADRIDRVSLDLNMSYEWGDKPDLVRIHQFFFSDFEVAKAMALRVQVSAKNIRKDDVRRIRLDEAGGFHDKSVIEKLYDIQQGRCYLSGDALIKKPKNYSIDHIQSIRNGGTNWPGNLALVLTEMNTRKGGRASAAETMKWLAAERGQRWLRDQKKYCKEVDLRREELDRAFRIKHGVHA